MDQNKKAEKNPQKLKDLNVILDKIIDKSKSFEEQKKIVKKIKTSKRVLAL